MIADYNDIFWPLDLEVEPDTLTPQQADVDVVLEEYVDESVPYGEVRA